MMLQRGERGQGGTHFVAAADENAPPHAQMTVPRKGHDFDILGFDRRAEYGELVVNVVNVAGELALTVLSR